MPSEVEHLLPQRLGDLQIIFLTGAVPNVGASPGPDDSHCFLEHRVLSWKAAAQLVSRKVANFHTSLNPTPELPPLWPPMTNKLLLVSTTAPIAYLPPDGTAELLH
jgi:hypothetical protein